MTRQITYMRLDEVVDAERNPKEHDTATIRTSISEFGYVEPIVLDERTGKLVAGHGRANDLRARREAGDDPPEGVEVEDGEWLVPVLTGWASKDDQQAEAYLLVSNRAAELGGWNERLLMEVLSDLPEAMFPAAGYDPDDLADLMAELDEMSATAGAGTASLGHTPKDREDTYRNAEIRSIIHSDT